jgi:hypothetical protein
MSPILDQISSSDKLCLLTLAQPNFFDSQTPHPLQVAIMQLKLYVVAAILAVCNAVAVPDEAAPAVSAAAADPAESAAPMIAQTQGCNFPNGIILEIHPLPE